jgi:hypothetical protein
MGSRGDEGMAKLRRIVLDVLKPHQPGVLEFSAALADSLDGCRIRLQVAERDEQTESVTVEVTGEEVEFEAVTVKINEMGGSIHSIDEVEVDPDPDRS